MVKLPEWRGKEVFRSYGIPLPRGLVLGSAAEVRKAISDGRVPLPCVVKAQVAAGGRGKGGAVQFADSVDQAERAAESILGMSFGGEIVKEILLEERLSIARELYLAITLDRGRRLPIVMSSSRGGIEIETVPPDAMLTTPVHPFVGLTSYERRAIGKALGVSGVVAKSLETVLQRCWDLFVREDAELVEINPLAVVGDGVVALDAKVIIEDDAGFRHPQYSDIRDDRTPLEEIAREKGIAFVQLDGNIGVIANGAGLTMATLDVLKEFGGEPGVFLDLGGTDDPGKVTEAFLLMAQAHPRAVFLNIFGGVTRCDTVARGLVEAMRQVPEAERFPFVARIRGNNEAEGIAILREAGFTSQSDLKASVQAVVAAARGIAPSAGATS
jgi:succinyl-CoA synthetase beta subunit